jgi:hypothetical protein
MAIAVTTPSTKVGFIDNATSGDVSGAEEIHAAVAGKKIKIKHLTINSTDAIAITIGAGQTGAGVTAALIGPIEFAAKATLQWNFWPLLELPAATNLSIDADGAGVINVFVQGVIE